MNYSFDNLLKIAFPIFVLLGLTEITAYYNKFNIFILDYLTLSEFITTFLGNIYLYILIFWFSSIIFLPKLKLTIIKALLFLFFMSMLLYIALLFGDIRFPWSPFVAISFGLFFIGQIIIIFPKLKISDHINEIKEDGTKWFFTFSIFTVALLLTGFKGQSDANFVKRDHIFDGTTLFLSDREIKSNDTSYFIGKTHDYYFFYNEIENSTTVYPASEIKKILIMTKLTNPKIRFGRPNGR
jgi:hypothetical protein